MRKTLSLVLALCMMLTMVPAGIAEDFFEEESFESFAAEDFIDLSFEEELPEASFVEEAPEQFEEETFFEDSAESFAEETFAEDVFQEEVPAEDTFEAPDFAEPEPAAEALTAEEMAGESEEVFVIEEPAEEPAPEIEEPKTEAAEDVVAADGFEDRSVVSMITDQTEGDSSAFADNVKTYWKVAPTVNVIQPKKDGVLVDGQIKLRWVSEWNVDKTALPANVKYYVYKVDPDTGVATQVKTASAKAISFTEDGRKVSGYGSAVTLNDQTGDEIYFVRAEKITATAEVYGLSSDLVYLSDRLPAFENGQWKTVTIRSLSEYTDKWDAEGNLSLMRLKATWSCGGVEDTAAADELDFIVKLTYQDKNANTIGKVKVIQDIQYETDGNGNFRNFAIEQTNEEVEEYTDQGATHVMLTVQAKKNGVKGAKAARTIQLSSDGTAYKKLVGLSGRQTGDNEVTLAIDFNRLTHQYKIGGLLTDEKLMYDQAAGTMLPKNAADKSCIQYIDFHYTTAAGESYTWSAVNRGSEFEQHTGGSPELLNQKGAAWIGITAKTKEAASVTVTVQPIKKTSTKAIQGEVHTVTITMRDSWRAKPVITSLTQSGIREATLCFTQNQTRVKPTAFIVYGFKAKAVVKVEDGQLTLPSSTTGITAVDTIKQEDGTYLYKITGAVAAEGESTFTVQPQLTENGTKQSGVKSDAAVLNVLPKAKTGVLNLAIGPWQDDGSGVTGKVEVTFVSIQPKANVEKFVISLADADSFAGSDAYKGKVTLTYKQEMDEAGNGYDEEAKLYHAVFTGVEKGKTYSALAETFTVNDGRLVDKVLSLVYGESPKDEAIAEKPDVEAIAANMEAKANGKDEAGNAVFIGTEVNLKDIVGAENFDIVIDEDDVIALPDEDGSYTVNLPAGEHSVRVRLTDPATGEKGTWSDPFALAVYEELEAVSATAPAEILLGSPVWVTLEAKGGSGSYTCRLSVTYDGQGEPKTYDGHEFTPDLKGSYTISVEIVDNKLTKDGQKLSVAYDQPAYVTVGDTFTVGDLTFQVMEEDATKVRVQSYNADGAETIVPATATEEVSGRSFAVTEIGEKAFFEKTSLAAVTLPNSIEVIGVSAFEGCTSLATMNSVDNP